MAAVSVAVALVVTGCTSTPSGPPVVTVAAGELRLAAFDSCDQALGDLRRAIMPLVGPYGIGGYGRIAVDGGPVAADRAAVPEAEAGAGKQADSSADDAANSTYPDHSGTNNHEAGVDEPDLVKTDGTRIVTVLDGALQVVDAASRRLTGSLLLPGPGGADELLLAGDHALVLRRGGFAIADRAGPGPMPVEASDLLLVDLTGNPSVRATFSIDGSLLDARMVGSTVRVVTQSQPRLQFDYPTSATGEADALRRNQQIVGDSTIDDWLPRYRLNQGGAESSGRIDCAAVSRPAKFSATSMLTVLTFDLGAGGGTLGTGDPVTIVADGDVVYGTADSLYVASDAARIVPLLRGAGRGIAPGEAPDSGAAPPDIEPPARTELYKFDTRGGGRPRHVASGAVAGSLLNQYSLSEYGGHLRVATTGTGPAGASVVSVLEQRGNTLATVGSVGGLGKGERIYAVRFAGPIGYVVTFRQTDPLYTLDLRNPAAPAVTGELKITGYSAYLHPVGDGRLLGIGQEANGQGRVQGLQVSLFDVSDPARPSRVAQYHVPGASSEVEYDPHALLYWPATRTLVLPVDEAATVLRVDPAALTELGRLAQPGTTGQVRRALVVGDTLWTVAQAGLAATDLATLTPRGWVAFGP